jgi:hypothetical protein
VGRPPYQKEAAVADEVTVEFEKIGPDQRAVDRAVRAIGKHAALREFLRGADTRLLGVDLIDPPRKTRRPTGPRSLRATYFDYTNNRTLAADAPLDDTARVTVAESADQPLPTREEFEAAVGILAEHRQLGRFVREGRVQPYEAMPPLVLNELPDGTVERVVTVGLLPQGRSRVRHEIVGVNMIRREIERYEDGAPDHSHADRQTCGAPPSAGQPTTGKGLAGQVWINVFQGGTRIWRFLAVRPSASSGTWGSGVELRFVDYRGRRVLYQAHVPILNVLYDGQCGPYRDWQYQEGMIDASGTNVAPGFLLCPTPAKTILDTGSDVGTFLGVAVYVQGQEVVLVSEMHAGWYRYVSEWRLHANGTIRPRFGFDATASSCVCIKHHHHVYWRLDFDIQTPGSNVVTEFNDPPISAGKGWHAKSYETMRLRDPGRKRRWRVTHSPSGRAYEIVPGTADGTAAGDPYARGDLWFLRYKPTEIDDAPIVGTEIQIDKYRTPPEPIVNQDVVVWYAGHFTHAPLGPHVSHIVGPELRPVNW